jgi:hypothetical protein
MITEATLLGRAVWPFQPGTDDTGVRKLLGCRQNAGNGPGPDQGIAVEEKVVLSGNLSDADIVAAGKAGVYGGTYEADKSVSIIVVEPAAQAFHRIIARSVVDDHHSGIVAELWKEGGQAVLYKTWRAIVHDNDAELNLLRRETVRLTMEACARLKHSRVVLLRVQPVCPLPWWAVAESMPGPFAIHLLHQNLKIPMNSANFASIMKTE